MVGGAGVAGDDFVHHGLRHIPIAVIVVTYDIDLRRWSSRGRDSRFRC